MRPGGSGTIRTSAAPRVWPMPGHRTVAEVDGERVVPLRVNRAMAGGDISMTWPQYRRHECTFNGQRHRMEPKMTELLLFLLIRRGQTITVGELIEMVWPDADGGPVTADNCIRVYLRRLRLAMPGLGVISFHGIGLMLPLPVALAQAA